MERVKVGIIGCGMISEIYLSNMTTIFSDALEVTACSDLIIEKAKEKAEKYNIKALSVDEMLLSEDVELIINLTIPVVHAEITKAALLHGKHVYSEKPLAINVSDGEELVRIAREKHLLLGCAPDTFMGGGLTKCFELMEQGAIGTPISMEGCMVGSGPESFHPAPESFYREGGGPLLDMGPYYVTTMLHFLGKARSVMGTAQQIKKERICKNPAREGEAFGSEVPTHVQAIITFGNGCTAMLTTSWEMEYPYWESGRACLVLRGTKGYIVMPDPNTYCGASDSPLAEPGKEIYVHTDADHYTAVPVDETYIANSRGLAASGMASAIRTGSSFQATGEMALETLKVLLGILESAEKGTIVNL